MSRRALTLSETKSEVPKWPVWTDPWIQKTSPPFEKVLTKSGNGNSNSFRPLQQPGQGGRAIPILEIGKTRHGTKALSEEPGASPSRTEARCITSSAQWAPEFQMWTKRP